MTSKPVLIGRRMAAPSVDARRSDGVGIAAIWLLAVGLVAAALVLTACGKAPSAPRPPVGGEAGSEDDDGGQFDDEAEEAPVELLAHERGPATAWQHVTDELTDGEVDLDTALAAFSLAVAPLPGAQTPDTDDTDDLPDASVAVAWVLRHHDQLTDDQAAVVAEALSPLTVADTDSTISSDAVGAPPSVHGRSRPAAAAGPRGATTGCWGQRIQEADSPGAEPFRSLLDPIAADLQSRLGGAVQMVAPVYLQVDSRELGLGRAYTWGDPGDCAQNGLDTCTIHLSPRAQRAPDAELTGILAHEMMHCLVFQHLGMTTYDLPAWVGEGIPAWVGEEIAGGTALSAQWWDEYLNEPSAPLYGRDYDAIGFYAHVAETGVDLWQRIVPILDGFENEPAFEAAFANGGAFLDSWPSGTLRRAELGSAWDTTGPGVTDSSATPIEVAVAAGSEVVRKVGKVGGVLVTPVTPAARLTVEVAGYARISTADGEQVVDGSLELCVQSGACGCDGGGGDLLVLGDGAVIAVTGGTDEARIVLTASSDTAEDDCDEASVEEEAATIDRCMVGTWTAYVMANKDLSTSMPVEYLGGGEGVTFTIRPDGTFTLDYDRSTPVVTRVAGMEMGTRTRGVATGRLTTSNGSFTVVEQDYATALRSTFTGAPGGGPTMAGGVGIRSGTYECDARHSLDTTSPTKLGEFVALWEAT